MSKKDDRIAELEDQVEVLTYERDGAIGSMEVCGHIHEKTTPRQIFKHELRKHQIVSFHDVQSNVVMGGELTEIARNDAGEIVVMMLNGGQNGRLLAGWTWDNTVITVHQDAPRPLFVADLKAAPAGAEVKLPGGRQNAVKTRRDAKNAHLPWRVGVGYVSHRDLAEEWPDGVLVLPDAIAKES